MWLIVLAKVSFSSIKYSWFSWSNPTHAKVSGDFAGSDAVSFIANHNDGVCCASSQDPKETPETFFFLSVVSQN